MSYTYLRWVRFGVAAALQDSLPAAGPRAQLGIQLTVSSTVTHSVAMPAAQLSVFGPGDVAGIDTRQVIRMFPVPNTGDFESSYFAHVEFDRPDLPWLFTPKAAGTDQRLRPWICLVVVERREGVTLEPAAPLPVLSIANGAAAELPELATINSWAHVQIAGSIDAGIESIARDQPERILSRLVCPRVLLPNKSYLACVVPTYSVGVDAGLGREVANDAALADAWTNASSVRLPVYHHWEFATGGAGDFKSLVTRLEARTPGPTVGTRPLDITTPRFGVADLAGEPPARLGGALCVVPPGAAPASANFAQAVAPVVNATNVVGPPIYGRWHAAASAVTSAGAAGWLDALNLDARYRVAAGLGTSVVQDRQEDLMAAVWAQFGEILRANQLLRQAQLAVAASERVVGRHFDALPDAALLALAGPALARIRAVPGKTMRGVVSESCLPLSALSGAFRRLARAHGPLERRFSHRARTHLTDVMPQPAIDTIALIERLASGALNARRPAPPSGAITVPAELLPSRGRRAVVRGELSPALKEFESAFVGLAARDAPVACTPLDVGTLAQTLRGALEPDVAIPPRLRAQITLPALRTRLSSRLDALMAAPEIPTPMIGPLLEQGDAYLLPGLADLPVNSVTIVEPDAAFIEAYFVGLNHEMARELLWRGFPTDQRGTVFSRFWDRRGAVPGATPVPGADITPIAGWQRAEALGSHLTQQASQLTVLLIRGDLLQRYPRATIYLQRARWQRDNGAIVYDDGVARREPVPLAAADAAGWQTFARFPSFSGRTGTDLAFLGFLLPRGEVRGLDSTALPADSMDEEAGWFVVFQEQPTEPRFGPTSATPATQKSEELARLLQRPAFRLFVHGSDLVRP